MNPASTPFSSAWSRPNPGASGSGRGRVLLAEPLEWVFIVTAGCAAAFLLSRFYVEISPWVGAGVFLFVATTLHMYFAARSIIPIPHVAILFSVFQVVIAAWGSYYYPSHPDVDIGDDLPDYLAYATPATLAHAAGWMIPLLLWTPPFWRRAPRLANPSRGLIRELNLLVLGGFAVLILLRLMSFGPLNFAVHLLSQVRYVGLIGLILIGARGWFWKMLLILGFDIMISFSSTMMHSLYLWGAILFGVFLFRFRPSLKQYLGIIGAAFFLVPVAEYAKWRVRSVTWFGTEEAPEFIDDRLQPTRMERSAMFLYFMTEGFGAMTEGRMDEDAASQVVRRFNQGWIINKVLNHVPAYEPHARGETIVAGFLNALVPRVLVPEKYRSGGRTPMERFAGYEITRSTSMNLGFAGEMYANFGRRGGVIACGLYALFFGTIFVALARSAASRLVLWAFIPFLYYWVLKAETGVPEVINWFTKAALVSAGVIFTLPAIHGMVYSKRRPSRSLAAATLRPAPSA